MRARHAFGRRREVMEPSEEPAEPTVDLEPVDVVPSRSRRWSGARRPTPIGMFAVGFLFLLAAVTAVGFAQFTASRLAPWLSIGFSAVAAICTGVALVLARER